MRWSSSFFFSRPRSALPVTVYAEDSPFSLAPRGACASRAAGSRCSAKARYDGAVASLVGLKDLLPYRARLALGEASRQLRYAALVVTRPGALQAKTCPVCSRRLVGFVHGGKLCPFCTSFPRHRMFWPLMQRWLAGACETVRVMHVAPDKCLRQPLLSHPNVQYLGIDRFTPGHYYPPDTRPGDIECLDQPTDAFDLVICSHVLEHVNDDAAALRELFRVTAPGGVALLCFPFRPGAVTHEDPTITDPNERARQFGQWDHVRFYGEDAADRMRAAGFEVTKLQAREVFDELSVERFALEPSEVFFVCRKPGTTSSLATVALA